MSVTIEQMIVAVLQARRKLRADARETLRATSALLRKIAEPSDGGFKSSGEPLPDTEANEQWVEFRKHQDAGFLAALATLHQPAPTAEDEKYFEKLKAEHDIDLTLEQKAWFTRGEGCAPPASRHHRDGRPE